MDPLTHADKVTLSIIVPTYKAAGTLAGCLESIVAQTFRDYELIVVDGGSTDATLDVVKEFANRSSKLRWRSEPDAGVYDAMNKGIAMSRGAWLYFAGADDELHDPTVLESVVPHLTPDTDLVYGKVLRVAKNRIEGGRFDNAKLFQTNICHQAIFYSADLLRTVGGYDLKFRVCADWDLNIRCFARLRRSTFVDLVICRYDGGGMSSRITDHLFYDTKLEVIARAHGARYWYPVFRTCRYEFLGRARRRRTARQWVGAASDYCMFLLHASLARLEKLGRRA